MISSSSLFLLLFLGGSLSFSGRAGLLQRCVLFLGSSRSGPLSCRNIQHKQVFK